MIPRITFENYQDAQIAMAAFNEYATGISREKRALAKTRALFEATSPEYAKLSAQIAGLQADYRRADDLFYLASNEFGRLFNQVEEVVANDLQISLQSHICPVCHDDHGGKDCRPSGYKGGEVNQAGFHAVDVNSAYPTSMDIVREGFGKA